MLRRKEKVQPTLIIMKKNNERNMMIKRRITKIKRLNIKGQPSSKENLNL
jgi:hypothetical protein